MIRIPQVRVIDEEGEQLGVMPTPRALEMAQERGYDLVEVAPMASPPVVRFLDFGQYKYELTKREKDNKRRSRSVSFKEVRLSPKIGQGDFDTKVHRAIEFLEDGDRIKVTVRFRGRELTHPEIGRALLGRFTEAIKEHGVVERQALLEGKQMHLTVASLHKPKGQEGGAKAAEAREGRPDEGRPAEARPAAARPAAPAANRPATPAPAAARPAENRPQGTEQASQPRQAAQTGGQAARPADAGNGAASAPANRTNNEPATPVASGPAKTPATTGE
jgi:translation initiation factor IF-3